MAPMTLAQVRTAYRRWGVPFREHVIDGRPGPFAPIGIMIHHTAGSDGAAGDAADERVLTTGRPDLPGPLCHDAGADDGLDIITAVERANHAGRGDGAVADRVLRGRRAGVTAPGPDDTDGNALFYGREVMYSGTRPMSDAQYRSTVLACAARCEHHGWNPLVVILGHREWTRRKIDPGHIDMDVLRRDVAAALAAGPGQFTDSGGSVTTLDDQDRTWLQAAIKNGVLGVLTEKRGRLGADPQLADASYADAIVVGARARLDATAAIADLKGTVQERLDALAAAVAGLPPAVDVQALATALGPLLQQPDLDEAELAQAIVAAMPDGLAQQTADVLAQRLAS